MARIYVSSTVADLLEERRAVIDWLVEARHQPVHSYRPDSETVRESCLLDIDSCDLYVLILGHRYGYQPETDNPANLSITHLEFRRAGQSGVPRVALLRMSVPDITLTDLLIPERAELVRRFGIEVGKEVRPAEFRDDRGLIQGLSTGVQSELDKLNRKRGSGKETTPDDPQIRRILDILMDDLDKSKAENLSLRGRVGELEEQLQAAVRRTLRNAGEPGAGEAAVAAAEALGAGDTRPAEALLRHQERDEAAGIVPGVADAGQRREAAALAREQGALAMGHDVRAALASFQRAAEYEPENVWTHFFIGDLHRRMGYLDAAMRSYARARELVEALAARDPANMGWQRDRSVSYNKIGNVLVAQGDGPGALAAYRKGLEIAEALAARDPANTEWQRDLSVSHNRIGDVLVARGDGPGALAAYGKLLKISEALAARDPANTEWQRDLSVSHNKIGNVLVAQGDGPGALAAYRKGLEIAEALAARDPANTEWQRDLSVSHNKIGDVLVAQGDGPGALAAYRKWLEIAEALAARDPANAKWQTDLAVSCAKLGAFTHDHTVGSRRKYLLRGRAILVKLKEKGRLHPKQDWIQWFDDQLAKLPQSRRERQT